MAEAIVVAIPARDEADRIAACLNALRRQDRRPDAVVLLLNNCSDTTEAIVRAIGPRLGSRLKVISRHLRPRHANAGNARRLAMEAAAALAGPRGMLLTTDADGVVPPDWITRNLGALRNGADVVCGRAVIDPVEAAMIPAHLHADDARECELIVRLDALAWVLDPEPHDPPPRHTEASGASLAVRAAAFWRCGGMPAIPSGEDRAFVRSLWMLDARVRHDPDIAVTVSGRIVGRAEGGMADTMRRRMVRQDEYCDDQAEPASDALRRYAFRNRVRHAWNGTRDSRLAGDLRVSPLTMALALGGPAFGSAWAVLEAASPVLARRKIRFRDLTTEIARADLLLRRLTPPGILAAD